MRTENFPRPPVERGYGRQRTPVLPTTVSVTPAPDRSEIRRFRKFLRFLLPFGNQAHTRAKNRRTPSQGCLLGWLSLTWTPRFNKTNVRTVRSLGIDIFSKRPKVPVSLLLTGGEAYWRSRWVLEEPLCNISTGQPGKKKFSVRPDGVRKNHVSPGHGETGDRKRLRHKS